MAAVAMFADEPPYRVQETGEAVGGRTWLAVGVKSG
jgi:hypothetical protein